MGKVEMDAKTAGKTDYRALALVARTLGTLQQSGVPILESMEIAAKNTDNRALAAAIMEARGNICEGEGIAKSLKETGMFPTMFITMVSNGEDTGKLDDMLFKTGDYYIEVAEDRGADEITIFAYQLATMLRAGLALGQSIAICAEHMEEKIQKVVEAISRDVTNGTNFAVALAKHPETFDPAFVAMAKAGEIGESLDTILQRIGELREFTTRAKRGSARNSLAL